MHVLILGSNGMLGRALVKVAIQNNYAVDTVDLANAKHIIDISNDTVLTNLVKDLRPDVIINTVAIIDHDKCEQSPGLAYQINTRPTGILALLCKEINAHLVQISTDHYFSGDQNALHDEQAPVTLLTEYARTKYLAECLALTYEKSLVLRTNIVGFRGEKTRPTFAEWALKALQEQQQLKLFSDYFTSSIDVATFSAYLFELIEKNATGLFNLAAHEALSKQHFIERLAQQFQLPLHNPIITTVKSLHGVRRAESLGLDVSKAEKILQKELPASDLVIQSLYQEFRNNDVQL